MTIEVTTNEIRDVSNQLRKMIFIIKKQNDIIDMKNVLIFFIALIGIIYLSCNLFR
jgi:hypothetical protein